MHSITVQFHKEGQLAGNMLQVYDPRTTSEREVLERMAALANDKKKSV